MSAPGFPFLLGFSVLVNIVVYNGIILFTFDDRCHNIISFLRSDVEGIQPLVKRPLGYSYGVTNSHDFEVSPL